MEFTELYSLMNFIKHRKFLPFNPCKESFICLMCRLKRESLILKSGLINIMGGWVGIDINRPAGAISEVGLTLPQLLRDFKKHKNYTIYCVFINRGIQNKGKFHSEVK